MTVFELGITARNNYLQIGDNDIMPHLLDGGGGGAAAEKLVQSTLDDFSKKKRKPLSEQHKRHISEAKKGHKVSEETRQKISEALRGENNFYYGKVGEETPFYGRKHTEETRRKISQWAKKQWEDPEFREIMSGESNPSKRPEVRAKISATMNQSDVKAKISGENNHMYGKSRIQTEETRKKMSAKAQGISIEEWKGYVSFEPYCPKFNDQLKESIRNRDSRTCVLCGKSELLNGRKLSVHHVDGSKTQGCRGEKWYLCALCVSCNSKTDTVEKEFLIVTRAEESRRSGL